MLKFKSEEAREAYNAIIENGSDDPLEGYSERHHIIPRSMGGTDDEWNLVYLTAENHLLAHYYLWTGTGDRAMGNAYFHMANTRWSKYDETPEVTDAMVEAYAKAKELSSAETAKRSSKLFKGVPKGEDHKRKISEALTGREFSKEHRAKIGRHSSTRVHTDETKRKIGKAVSGKANGFYGRKHDAETRKRMSLAKKGKPRPKLTAETRAKISASNMGKNTKRIRNDLTGEVFNSVALAAENFGVHPRTIRDWILAGKNNISYA